jgi:hypothetical protein
MLAASRISLGSLLLVSHPVFIKHTLGDLKLLWINMATMYENLCGNWQLV